MEALGCIEVTPEDTGGVTGRPWEALVIHGRALGCPQRALRWHWEALGGTRISLEGTGVVLGDSEKL